MDSNQSNYYKTFGDIVYGQNQLICSKPEMKIPIKIEFYALLGVPIATAKGITNYKSLTISSQPRVNQRFLMTEQSQA